MLGCVAADEDRSPEGFDCVDHFLVESCLGRSVETNYSSIPLGGHLFSVFPWAHLLFSETALLRWCADFKPDKPRSLADAGVNRMTVRRFCQLIEQSSFDVVTLEVVPIRRLRWVATRLTREFTTAVVRCRLTLPSSAET
jgi:hypothetical protein